MPGFINLLPDELRRPQRKGPEEIIPVPSEALPDFGTPEILIPDDFWSNLKQFLFVPPVKVIERPGAPFTENAYGSGMLDNLKFFFSAPKVSKAPINKRLEVDWGGNFGSFKDRIKDFFNPPKPVPLPPGIQPVKVKDIWTKDENFGWTQAIAFAIHAGVVALLVTPFIMTWTQPIKAVNKSQIDVTALDISPYVSKLPAGANKAGGGGGGGDRSPEPPTKGKAPRFAMTQFTPPTAVIKNPDPKLPMEPTLLGPPELKVANPNLSNFGDPLAASVTMSNGPGGGGGIGTGEGGGTGGGMFHAGVNGVGLPSCFYMPNPPYSEEARKAKYSGIVLVEAVVNLDGKLSNLRVIKSPGLGLDENTLTTLRTWRCKPAIGPNGKPVPVIVPFEVNFRLY